MSSYDEFGLLVEVGSSLGLWLGLCVTTLFDFIVTTVLSSPINCNCSKGIKNTN